MSRMTAAQVIGLGDYLEPNFEPSTLTVSQLLGVLSYHNVDYPTPYTKSKLVAAFNSEIKTRAAKYKKERIRKENSIASEDGITDGVTGKPLRAPVKATPTSTRRSSRRLSVNPIEPSSPTEEPIPVPEPSKRRRSSAQPSVGGNRRAAPVAAVPVLIEESEPEDDDESLMPPRKVVRTKKTTSTTGATSRRVSHLSGGEDSGWEDNNIFQSGAESSSPARASPVKPRLSRASPKKGRKSTSAPPQIVDHNSQVSVNPLHSPPMSPFRPSLAPIPAFDFSPPPSARHLTPIRDVTLAIPSREATPNDVASNGNATPARGTTPIYDSSPVRGVTPIRNSTPARGVTPIRSPTPARGVTPNRGAASRALSPVESAGDDQEFSESHNNLEVTVQASQDDEKIDQALALMEAENEHTSSGAMALYQGDHYSVSWMGLFVRGLAWCAIVALAYSISVYKNESSAIGFCDRGSNTSAVLNKILSDRESKLICVAKALEGLPNATEYNVSDFKTATNATCGLPPLFPLPQPDSCTQCPDHATCSETTVICDNGFLMKPHILLSFIPVSPSQTTLTTKHVPALSENFLKAVSKLSDGLPGFGSVAFPPRCVADPQRKASIGKLGKAIESMLAKERGRRVCRGGLTEDSENVEGSEAALKWGVEVDKLKEVFKKTASEKMLPHFDEMFNEAIQQLIQWGGVFIGESTDGTRYAAHKFPVMSLECMITVKARKVWTAWRSTVLGAILTALLALGGRRYVKQSQLEKKRVAGLVQVALDTIRHQELAHFTDSVTTPEPYLSSIQLRDLVLQDEHSVSTRRRLWDRVEAIVEENANVRANLEESEGGDELRVWRWVGAAGATRSPGRKEIEFQED